MTFPDCLKDYLRLLKKVLSGDNKKTVDTFWTSWTDKSLEDDIFDTFLIVQAETAESTTACTFNLPMIQYT